MFNSTKAFIFTLDEVLFPKKDYDLQVYYLFAEFMEYIEQKDSKAILEFLKNQYETVGELALFDKLASQFSIDEKYKYNFDLLHETARLPLKLLLFDKMLALLQAAVIERKPVFLWATGKPEIAINKIKQIEWNGLEQYLTIYFAAEYNHSLLHGIEDIRNKYQLSTKDISLFIADTDTNEYSSAGVKIIRPVEFL